MSETATTQRLKLDSEEHQVRQIVYFLYYNILRDYIGRANEREVIDDLYKFYTESDLTLISKQQLRVYQELEKTVISTTGFLKNG